MEAYLNRSIKEVMTAFPAVEKILDEYGIGCGPCAVGSCLLKDIVEIHNLPEEDEIMLPWMDKQISTPQVGELFARFNAADEPMGSAPKKYAAFIERLEKQFTPKKGGTT